MAVVVPPIKSQGIKTKLASWIKKVSGGSSYERWVEPFMGTGVVAFNVRPKVALMCDSNPHIVNFYQSMQAGKITSRKAFEYLSVEGDALLRSDGEYYYDVRDRFNEKGDSLDFLFLSRSCFNGMMRFNKKGGFNVPFCRKPNRFARALVTKICNQIDTVSKIIQLGNYTFKIQGFEDTISECRSGDIFYCDPPYIGRHVDYFDSWTEEQEILLRDCLRDSDSGFIMSTWLGNKYRENEYVKTIWGDCFISTKEHFYHVGGREQNRNSVTEALLTNFYVPGSQSLQESILKNDSLARSDFYTETQDSIAV